MKKHIHLFGASGSGTTTIAAQLSARLGCAHFDADRYFWLPTAEPFTQENATGRNACGCSAAISQVQTAGC